MAQSVLRTLFGWQLFEYTITVLIVVLLLYCLCTSTGLLNGSANPVTRYTRLLPHGQKYPGEKNAHGVLCMLAAVQVGSAKFLGQYSALVYAMIVSQLVSQLVACTLLLVEL